MEEEKREEIVLGVCAMEKKTSSTPMQEILKRIGQDNFEICVFDNETILNKPIEEWPLCTALVSFYSNGFPLEKAKSYVALRKPILVNDLVSQHLLFDRRDVYRILQENGIPVPPHAILCREIPGQDQLIEGENMVIVNGKTIRKPFVEKPVNAEDHNICIYYPSQVGGGSKRLFRKIKNQSSQFYPNVNSVRKEGSFIYEEFLNTQGIDIKVYTVGPYYGHAEARKSPVLDGKVVRDENGKEVRYPVILNKQEKQIARKVCLAFKQTICGFDLLRVGGESFVCDVNGWSFVKNSKKYYDDCAVLLRNIIRRSISPWFHNKTPPIQKILSRRSSFNLDDRSIYKQSQQQKQLPQKQPPQKQPPQKQPPQKQQQETFQQSLEQPLEQPLLDQIKKRQELRCVIALVRHGDRTPKQKLKTLVGHPQILSFFGKYSDCPTKEVRIKSIAGLEKILDILREITKNKEDEEGIHEMLQETEEDEEGGMEKLLQMKLALERQKISGIYRKVQFKPREWKLKNIQKEDSNENSNNNNKDRKTTGQHQVYEITKLLMIMKWGGDLTPAGVAQGEELGRHFRKNLYNEDEAGLLRLHSTYRHDLKIYSSDEGRVQMTAAAFAKGFLELEGDLTPILVSLVTTLGKETNNSLLHCEGLNNKFKIRHYYLGKETNNMLDYSGQTQIHQEMKKAQSELHDILYHYHPKRDHPSSSTCCSSIEEENLHKLVAPLDTTSILQALDCIKEPRKALHRLVDLLQASMIQIEKDLHSSKESHETLYYGESFSVFYERWKKITKAFYNEKKNLLNLQKIQDIYDCIRYDMLHNRIKYFSQELYDLARAFSHCLTPQQYGRTKEEKRSIGTQVCQSLVTKIREDLRTAIRSSLVETDYETELQSYRLDANDLLMDSPSRRVRSRLYFTSESHLLALLNLLRHYERKNKTKPNTLTTSSEEEKASITTTTTLTKVVEHQGTSSTPQSKTLLVEEKKKENHTAPLESCPSHCKDVLDHDTLIFDDVLEHLDRIPECSYLSHIVFRLFEVTGGDNQSGDPPLFRVEIAFSPGTQGCPKDGEFSQNPLPVSCTFPLASSFCAIALDQVLSDIASNPSHPSPHEKEDKEMVC